MQAEKVWTFSIFVQNWILFAENRVQHKNYIWFMRFCIVFMSGAANVKWFLFSAGNQTEDNPISLTILNLLFEEWRSGNLLEAFAAQFLMLVKCYKEL